MWKCLSYLFYWIPHCLIQLLWAFVPYVLCASTCLGLFYFKSPVNFAQCPTLRSMAAVRAMISRWMRLSLAQVWGHQYVLSGVPLPTHLSTARMLISHSERAQLLCGRKESRWIQRHLQCTCTQEISYKPQCTKPKWSSVRLTQVQNDFFGDKRRKLFSALSRRGTFHHNHHFFLMLRF